MSESSRNGTTKTLIAFDFDWTLVDEDTDRYVYATLSPPTLEKLLSLHKTVQWTDLNNQLHQELYELGIPALHVMNTWRNIPFNPATAEALRLAHAQGAEIIILSDANTISIEAILRHHDLRHLFSKIITNPAHYDDIGCLRVKRLIPADGPQHGCPNGCAVNICKGQQLLDHIAQNGPYSKIIYAGDGRNDLCPSTKLRRTDYVLPRTGHALAKILSASPSAKLPNEELTMKSQTETNTDSDADADPVRRVPEDTKNAVVANLKFWETGNDLLAVLKSLLQP
ncbi:putative phosphatase-domain-containing protein [Fimicolochytrium jonesii]|uniref:putative phosphatase-domain-containing protein n=1 Tax=Fimicolochytrium jonesii TaxID=1396493 RepID=UPI0022FEACF8|nr:putative phosphatase-domain-containing protein [Fimicolochytrium jonesii]KAI8822526.1 putative phosphatase-domain-containing protein [Fimicolochytrium jonesii]